MLQHQHQKDQHIGKSSDRGVSAVSTGGVMLAVLSHLYRN